MDLDIVMFFLGMSIAAFFGTCGPVNTSSRRLVSFYYARRVS